ncbi:MAG: hypothetical protein RLZZ301_1492 [Bacteroidota bacterium]|jgi:hypothetical protein
MKLLVLFALILVGFSSCWPEAFSFRDTGGMPDEWHTFTVRNLENEAPNCPLSFPALLSENIKDGVQNNTRLALQTSYGKGEVNIEGKITGYQVQPVAIQGSDNATSNRLTMTLQFNIHITTPKEEDWQLVSTRFSDFSAGTNLADVERKLFDEISAQVVQDVINKLYSNW